MVRDLLQYSPHLTSLTYHVVVQKISTVIVSIVCFYIEDLNQYSIMDLFVQIKHSTYLAS